MTVTLPPDTHTSRKVTTVVEIVGGIAMLTDPRAARIERLPPEELLIASVNLGLASAFREAAGELAVSYSSEAIGEIELRQGRQCITAITLRPSIVVAEPRHVAEVAKALDEAIENCMIAASLREEVALEQHIEVAVLAHA